MNVGIYRESTPKDIEEMINEMKDDGTYQEMRKRVDIDFLKANYWATIGIGCKDYYN